MSKISHRVMIPKMARQVTKIRMTEKIPQADEVLKKIEKAFTEQGFTPESRKYFLDYVCGNRDYILTHFKLGDGGDLLGLLIIIAVSDATKPGYQYQSTNIALETILRDKFLEYLMADTKTYNDVCDGTCAKHNLQFHRDVLRISDATNSITILNIMMDRIRQKPTHPSIILFRTVLASYYYGKFTEEYRQKLFICLKEIDNIYGSIDDFITFPEESRTEKEEYIKNFFFYEELFSDIQGVIYYTIECVHNVYHEDFLKGLAYVRDKLSKPSSDKSLKAFSRFISIIWQYFTEKQKNKSPETLLLNKSNKKSRKALVSYLKYRKEIQIAENATYSTNLSEFLDDILKKEYEPYWNVSLWKLLSYFESYCPRINEARKRFLAKNVKKVEEVTIPEPIKPIEIVTLEPLIVEKVVIVEELPSKAVVLCFGCLQCIDEVVKVKCESKCTSTWHKSCWDFFRGDKNIVECPSEFCTSNCISWKILGKTFLFEKENPVEKEYKQKEIVIIESKVEEVQKKEHVYLGDSYRNFSTQDYENLATDNLLSRVQKQEKNYNKRRNKKQRSNKILTLDQLVDTEVKESDVEEPPMILKLDPAMRTDEKPIYKSKFGLSANASVFVPNYDF